MPNTNGFTGLVVSQNSDDNITICGLDPNNNPSCIIDPMGRSRKEVCLSATQGSFELPSTFSEVKAVDNGGDHEGGSYTVIAMNRCSFEAAGGGISFNSAGNISLMGLGGIVNVVATAQTEIFSPVIKLDATEVTVINGPKIDINSEVINLTNYTVFHKNADVQGSLSVNGELYTTHITGMQDKFQTENHPPMTLFFDQGMVFKGLLSIKEAFPSGSPYMPTATVVQAELIMPDPNMLMTKMGWCPQHNHDFYHLAADLKKSPDEVWGEAEALESASGPVKAKPADNLMKSLTALPGKLMASALTTLSNAAGF